MFECQKNKNFGAGDLVVVHPDFDIDRYLTYAGIALGSSEAFINGAILRDVELTTYENPSETSLKLQIEYQQRYMDMLHKTLSYDFNKIQVGDAFSYEASEYIYLGEFMKADEKRFLYLVLDVYLNRFGSNQPAAKRLHNKLISGEVSQHYLYRYIKRYKGINFTSEIHKDFYFVRHYNLPVSDRLKQFLSDLIG